MDINQFQRIIRSVVNDENALLWLNSQDRHQFCKDLIGQLDEHEVVLSIIEEVLYELLERRAEDKFANYFQGDGVTILESGHSIPATVIERSHSEDTLVVQLDKIFADGHFEEDRCGEVIVFHRSHDQVYVHTEGRKLSRLIAGRRYVEYSTEHLQSRFEQLNHKKAG